MKILGSLLTLVASVAAGLTCGAGVSHAGLDNQYSIVDGKGRTLTIEQLDTFLNGVAPLDRNRLTREWFHSGKASYTVTGDGADQFTGTMQLGYQVGFPWSLGVGINFKYTTPNVLLDKASIAPQNFNPLGSVITPNLLPGVSIAANLGNGPGIQEVNTFTVDVRGPKALSRYRMRTAPSPAQPAAYCCARSPACSPRPVTASPPTANRGT